MEISTRVSTKDKIIMDFHIHSIYSFDSLVTPSKIIQTAKKKGLNGVAITDHNTIKGAMEAMAINQDPKFVVIVGSEIATDAGDIIGLFLEEEITIRDAEQVLDAIHKQGGVAVLPHPFKGHKFSDDILRKIDLIECFNSRTSEKSNEKAIKLAKIYNKPVIAGSDAHFAREIGSCLIAFDSRDTLSLKAKLLNGDFSIIKNTYSPIYMESLSQLIKAFKTRRYQKIARNTASLVKQILLYFIRKGERR